jgi:hypothetical protein
MRQIKVMLLRLENWCDINGVESVGLSVFKTSGVERVGADIAVGLYEHEER